MSRQDIRMTALFRLKQPAVIVTALFLKNIQKVSTSPKPVAMTVTTLMK
jgi:hypothetical protein